MFYGMRQHISLPNKSRCSVSRMPGWLCPCPRPSQVTCQGSRAMEMFPHMDICSNVSLKRWTNMERILTTHHLISCKYWLTHDYFLTLWSLQLELKTMLPRCDDHVRPGAWSPVLHLIPHTAQIPRYTTPHYSGFHFTFLVSDRYKA